MRNLVSGYGSSTLNAPSQDTLESKNFSELPSNIRFLRFSNPIISYDYKTGNYVGQWENLYPSLFVSYIEVARNIRKAPWVFSDQYEDFLKKVLNTFNTRFTTQMNLQLSDVDNWYSSHVSPMDNYLNMYYLLNKNGGIVNMR
jgi:hypothetical protein